MSEILHELLLKLGTVEQWLTEITEKDGIDYATVEFELNWAKNVIRVAIMEATEG
jgi:hypothetical protein